MGRQAIVVLVSFVISCYANAQIESQEVALKMIVEELMTDEHIRSVAVQLEDRSTVFFQEMVSESKDNSELSDSRDGSGYAIWSGQKLFFYKIDYYFVFTEFETSEGRIFCRFITQKRGSLIRPRISGVIQFHRNGNEWSVKKMKVKRLSM